MQATVYACMLTLINDVINLQLIKDNRFTNELASLFFLKKENLSAFIEN